MKSQAPFTNKQLYGHCDRCYKERGVTNLAKFRVGVRDTADPWLFKPKGGLEETLGLAPSEVLEEWHQEERTQSESPKLTSDSLDDSGRWFDLFIKHTASPEFALDIFSCIPLDELCLGVLRRPL